MIEMICIVCPVGCHLQVEESTLKVMGNGCIRGETYGKKEIVNPVRNITSTMGVVNGVAPIVSVKTSREIPKSKIFDVMNEINHTMVDAPVACGEVLIRNVCGLDCNIVATKTILEKPGSE